MSLTPSRIVIALAVILAAWLPSDVALSDDGVAVTHDTGVVLGDVAQSHVPCRLFVRSGSETMVLRGVLPAIAGECTLLGAFRLWREPAGRMLYLYDDAQNLVGRVVNPESVLLLGVDEPTR